jgi:transposase-like protein
VALAAIKDNQTANEIASEFGIHVSLVNRWKKEAIEASTRRQRGRTKNQPREL